MDIRNLIMDTYYLVMDIRNYFIYIYVIRGLMCVWISMNDSMTSVYFCVKWWQNSLIFIKHVY